MNIAELFIRRPVTTTLLTAGVLIFGVMAYRQLPVSDLPAVDFPFIQVTASLPGASPETMASSVATPLEREFSTIAGVEAMTSTNLLGTTQIALQFRLERDIDAAAQDVQAAIARAQRQLPPDMPNPPSYQKVNPTDQPVLYLALTSPTLPLYELNEYADTLMAQRISMVSGVAQVVVYGMQKYAVRVQLDPDTLAARGIGLDEVVRAVQEANVELPTGSLDGRHQAYTIEASGKLLNAAGFEPVIVAYREGRPVRLSELGRVIDSVAADKVAAWYVDQRAVVLAIQRQPGTNTVAVVDEVKKLLPTFRRQLPASVSVHELYDRSQSIRESVRDVKFTLWLTLALVVLVIFLFLRNLRATLIPGVAIPMSIIGTFMVMQWLGFSLDNLSLMALTLSVGFVVDDAIVMLENIVRHMELGQPRLTAALDGSREIGFTIVSMTLSLAAVFIPVLFMGGIPGRLFREFAVTIGVAILISGVVSLTLTPMMCSRLLGEPGAARHGRLYAASERFFAGMLRAYDVSLRWVLRHRRATMLFSAAVLVATIYLFRVAPKGFLPAEDTGRLMAFTEAAQGISSQAMWDKQQQVAAIVRSHPAVESFMSVAGGLPGRPSNEGILFLRLKPRSERTQRVEQVIAELTPRVNAVPGIRTYFFNPPPIPIGGRMTKSEYQYTLQSPDTDELYRLAPVLTERLREIPLIRDVTSDLKLVNPQVRIEIDRDKASALGVTPEQIERALSSAYGARQISTIYATNNQYDVIVELLPEYRTDFNALPKLYIRSAGGQLVPLSAVARIEPGVGPLTINHSGQLPSVTISFNLAPGVALGDAVAAVEAVARQTLPATITGGFQGTAQAFQSSVAGMGLLLVIAILVIYLVLGILYESFIHPITILSALPFAGFGALVTLLLFGVDVSLYAFVGIIMLVGLVKKNGIMMIDFAIEAQRSEQKPPEQAIHDACLIRFRPIMMTTAAALMGTLPIALGFGAGAESRRPLGLAVVGGLLFSQMLTLFVTPVFYLYMEKLRTWPLRRRQPLAVPVPAVVPAATSHP